MSCMFPRLIQPFVLLDKDVHRTDRTIPFYAKEDMPNPDPLMYGGTNHNLERLKDILCTYNIYNTELGYVQGMSDLLSPLYAVIGEEPLVFAAFAGFMERTVCSLHKFYCISLTYYRCFIPNARSLISAWTGQECSDSCSQWMLSCNLWIPVFTSTCSVQTATTCSSVSDGSWSGSSANSPGKIQ